MTYETFLMRCTNFTSTHRLNKYFNYRSPREKKRKKSTIRWLKKVKHLTQMNWFLFENNVYVLLLQHLQTLVISSCAIINFIKGKKKTIGYLEKNVFFSLIWRKRKQHATWIRAIVEQQVNKFRIMGQCEENSRAELD